MVYYFSMEDLCFLPDLPSGPLDVYRRSASFDWKRLKLALEGDIDFLKLKVSICRSLLSFFIIKMFSFCTGDLGKDLMFRKTFSKVSQFFCTFLFCDINCNARI